MKRSNFFKAIIFISLSFQALQSFACKKADAYYCAIIENQLTEIEEKYQAVRGALLHEAYYINLNRNNAIKIQTAFTSRLALANENLKKCQSNDPYLIETCRRNFFKTYSGLYWVIAQIDLFLNSYEILLGKLLYPIQFVKFEQKMQVIKERTHDELKDYGEKYQNYIPKMANNFLQIGNLDLDHSEFCANKYLKEKFYSRIIDGKLYLIPGREQILLTYLYQYSGRCGFSHPLERLLTQGGVRLKLVDLIDYSHKSAKNLCVKYSGLKRALKSYIELCNSAAVSDKDLSPIYISFVDDEEKTKYKTRASK